MLKTSSITEDMFYYFEGLKNNRFTGSFMLEGGTNIKWKFYFRLGRLIWASGGHDPQERWQRNLAVLCPQITPEQLEEISKYLGTDRGYTILSHLHKQGNPTEKKQLAKLIVTVLSEVFFDIVQYESIENKTISYKTIDDDKLDNLIILVDLEKVYQKTQKTWQDWVEADLSYYSPNLFAIIQQSEKYPQEITRKLPCNLISSIDGTYTLKALAAIGKQEIIDLTTTLVSLMSEGFITFSKTAKNPNTSSFSFRKFKTLLAGCYSNQDVPIPKSPPARKSSKPLVVCIDDSPLVAQSLGEFVDEQGYNFISIKEPMNALAILLKNPPDLIFLDLIMPVINGYELCSQLRRAPNLKNVPIVILTSKDGLVDRVRAKLVGGNSFLSKPVTKDELLATLVKHTKFS